MEKVEKILRLVEDFKDKFSHGPRVFRSPGRINIIGEHVDYHNGFVMPAAINREIVLLISPSSNSSAIHAVDLNETVHFSVRNMQGVTESWSHYILGVIDQLHKKGKNIPEVNISFTGDIPAGAGMSSSAAIECATIYALNEIFQLGIPKLEMIKLAQRAENEYVGVNCGIMDQFASMMSMSNGAVKLDCRDLTFETVSMDLKDYHLLLIDSEVKHSLASSEYNVRRQECDQALKVIQSEYPAIISFRDLQADQLLHCKDKLSDKLYGRCEFVIQEIERVEKAYQALKNQDLETLGVLLYQSHEGLQHKYEVSCEELDFLVDFTRNKKEVLGARMMGGGFGGCSINLIAKDAIPQFSNVVSAAFQDKYGIKPAIYDVELAQGTVEINL